ncbi:unnamed protein product, partial [Tetraodon nigroviridis]
AMPSSAGPNSPGAALAEALENSVRLIDRHLQDDRCFPDLSELLGVPSHNMPSVSGVSDMDYPLQGPSLLSVPNLPELNAVRRVPLPPELVEQFSHMQCNCMMGVFPEICRAWLTIDNDIFMWNYEDGGDVAYFDGLIETILAVGLVKPKQGILQPHIHYLLVLATSVDVVILGLSFPKGHAGLNDSMSGGMQLLPDPLFSIPTDNTYILSITSTDLGRIFMAGKDGCLYEIAYQAEAGWLSQRCRKINHSKSSLSFLIPSVLQFSFSEDDPIVQIAIDNTRNTLFTRSEKGVLQVYDLGADGQGMSRVATMTQNSIVAAAGNIARTIDRSVFRPIVHISVIDRSESSDCHLLAVTHAGLTLDRQTNHIAPLVTSYLVLFLSIVSIPSSIGVMPPALATPFAPMVHSGPGSIAPITPVTASPEVIFSGKHNGICIYFARILGNIWDGSLAVEQNISRGNQTVSILESSVGLCELESVILELGGLREFLDKNSQISPSSLGAASFSSPANLQQRLLGFMRPDGANSQQVQQELQRKYHTKAQVYEKISLQGIQQLVHRSYQTLALWRLLCEHQFSLIMSELPKEFQEQIKAVGFKDVVIRGKELSGALITALINVYIKDNASVDAISNHLRDICPLLYSSDDSICSKANELLQSSKQIQNKVDKERTLRESLQLYQQISQHTDLPLVCFQYRQVRFYEGVLELCLTAADKKDPQRLGPHFYKNGEPEEDRVGQQAFQERLLCYKCITDTMQELVNQSKAAPQSPSVPKQPGPPVMTSDPNMLSNEEAAAHFEQMLSLAQRSQDELFHIAMYNWLIQADLTDKLLEVNSPYLEEHLMHMIKQDQNKVHNMDLLWRYYEKNRSFGKAAHVLARLADMQSTEISLKQRLEYIARAILSAKSSSSISAQASDGEFLHELEEKMDLVRIQVQIQETLIRQYSHHSSVKNAISQLDSELMDITKVTKTGHKSQHLALLCIFCPRGVMCDVDQCLLAQLYGEFADHFKLSECKLAIIHCGGHSDPILVQSLWQEIMEKGKCQRSGAGEK